MNIESPARLYFRLKRKIAYLKGDKDAVSRWTNVLQTHRVIPVLRTEFNESVPPMIHVEITTDCNYRCPFCAQSRMKRPSKYISTTTFDRLIAELKSMNYNSSIVLFVDNEPFMHPDLMYFCEKISSDLPLADYSVQTNGSLVTKEHILFLGGLERPPLLLVDDYTPEKEITAQIKSWLVPFRGTSLDQRTMFFDRSWNEKLSNFAGNAVGQEATIDLYGDVICTWPFLSIFLDTELKAFLCCFDYCHSKMMGDLSWQSIMEVWRSQPYRDLRAGMMERQRRDLPLCGGCNVEWFNLPAYCGKTGSGS